MPLNPEIIDRAGELKRRLVDFASGRRYRRDLHRWMTQQSEGEIDPDDPINPFDRFILEHRFPDGSSVVDHFLRAQRDLTEADRALVLRWKEPVEGLFEVRKRRGNSLELFNLADELVYRVHSTVEEFPFERVPSGWFLLTRLMPVEDEWVFSGAARPLPPEARRDVLRTVGMMIAANPRLPFRNPQLLARAWELQREDREAFIQFFGADEVVLPGRDLGERMRELLRFKVFEFRGQDGKTAAERHRKLHGEDPALPEGPVLPEELSEFEMVGLVYDERDGLSILPDYGLVEEAFADPSRLSDRRRRGAVREYLRSPSISAWVIRRLAARYPEGATEVVRKLSPLRSGLTWEKDGEDLLRRFKPADFEREPLPTLTVVPSEVTKAMNQAAKRPAVSEGRLPGRNEPCPCGSGRKYKHCCGRGR
jgi:hypothetical protein